MAIAQDPTRTTTRSGAPSGVLLTLNRGIQVLEQIARDEGRATAKSLAADLDINLGTCYQLLRTLQANGYTHRLPGGRYALGTRIGFLLEQYERVSAPAPELIDILHDLHHDLQETVYITARRGRDIAIVEVLEGTRMLRVGNMQAGYGGYNNVRASAKAYLSITPEDALDDFFESREFEALTPNTITSWDGLLEELATTRNRGYGIDNEEYALGVVCIGAVVVDEEGRPYGSFATSFPASRLAEEEAGISSRVMQAAEAGSRALGYTGPYPPLGPPA